VATYHGKKGVVYISTTGTGTASSLTKLNSWSLDRSTDRAETTAFGDSNKTYVQGLPDVSGDFAGFYDDTEDKLWSAAESADGCKLYLYPSADVPTEYWYGPAWVDYGLEVGVGDAVKISGSFAANGAWGRKP